MTIDTTQPVDKRLKKMTIKEQIKILDNKTKQNQADYDLYRQNAKISALSSGKLDKYEYLSSEDLKYRPDPIEKAKSEYSPLGQVFTKGLDSSEKQEGLLRRLQNIEGKNGQQLDLIREQGDRQFQANVDKIEATDFYRGKNKKMLNLAKEANDIADKNRTDDKRILTFTINGNTYDSIYIRAKYTRKSRR